MSDPAWTPHALANLDRLSQHRLSPPPIIGEPHSTTRAYLVDHAKIPYVYKYDPSAFDHLSNDLRDLLTRPESHSLEFQAGLARAVESNRRQFPAHGERGLESPFLEEMLAVMLDRKRERKWVKVPNPSDLGLFTEERWICLNVEVKCGYNVDHEGDGGTSIVVLSETFFEVMMDYFRHHDVTIDSTGLGPKGFPVPTFHGFIRGTDDEENMRRVLAQIRSEFCSIQMTSENRGNRFIVLSTWRHACLFTIHPDKITISPVVSYDGICTPQRPIGNVAALMYTLSNLEVSAYSVHLDPISPRRTRADTAGRRGAGAPTGGAGQGVRLVGRGGEGGGGAGAGAGEDARHIGRGGAGGGGDGSGRNRGERAQQDQHDSSQSQLVVSLASGTVVGVSAESQVVVAHPLIKQAARVVSGSSFSSGSSRVSMDSQRISTPATSLTTSTFSTEPVKSSPAAVKVSPGSLKVTFDLPTHVARETLPLSHYPDLSILSQGVYLSHCLGSITDMRPYLSHPEGSDGLVLRVDGYLGIGATATVFSAYPDGPGSSPGRRLALRYTGPELFPRKGEAHDGGWDQYSVVKSIHTTHRALGIIERSGEGRITPRWYGTWVGNQMAMGKVWCVVLEAAKPVRGNISAEDKVQIREAYAHLHALGIIHGDVTVRNLCRMGPLPSPLSSSESGAGGEGGGAEGGAGGKMGLIDFGISLFLRGPTADHDERGGGGGGQEAGDLEPEVFAELAEREMREVEAMLEGL